MSRTERSLVVDSKPRAFDVICAGEALLTVSDQERSAERVRLRPGGGAVTVALVLARQGLKVGLATVLADDSAGRAIRAQVAASGVDIDGIELAQPSSALFFVRGGARQIVSSREEEQPISVPTGWSSQVLLLSGMSPVVSQAASLCRAARAARRAGTIVVVDVNANWHQWQGRDARAIRMVLREADVVSCSAQDLFGLKMDLVALREVLRPTAVLVVTDGAGTARAIGPFGEIAHALPKTEKPAPLVEGAAFAAAICTELARTGHADENGGQLWARTLERAHSASTHMDR